jgi:hypothetical protein
MLEGVEGRPGVTSGQPYMASKELISEAFKGGLGLEES